MASTVTIFPPAISRCQYCNERIGWIRSPRTGKTYPVNLMTDGSTGGRARTNDFHNCRQSAPARPAVSTRSVPQAPVAPQATQAATDSLRAILAEPITNPLTVEELVALRQTVTRVLDIYAGAYYRHNVTQGVEPLTVIRDYAKGMELLVAAQVVEMSNSIVASRVVAPVPGPVPSTSLAAIVDRTEAGVEPEPDNASGPEPIPGDWTASDDDVPF